MKNFVPAISLEGFESANDGRRGNGVFDKVMKAMALLKNTSFHSVSLPAIQARTIRILPVKSILI